MNFTTLVLAEMKTVELRKLAGSLGVKGMSSARKDDLLAVLVPMQETAKAAEAPKPAKASKQSKRCEACGIRPTGKAAKADGLGHLCDACYEESGWENEHSDHGHESIDSLTFEKSNFTEQEQFDAYVAATHERKESCWICKPELNKASETYVAKAGTSRAGMVFQVSIKANAHTKAQQVAEKLATLGITVTTTKGKGGTVEISDVTNGIYFTWTARGALGERICQGKKVRNVSEMLRKLAAK